MTTYFTCQKLRASDLEFLLGPTSPLPLGIVARGNRTTASSGTTTEIGVLRLDDFPVYAGRLYLVTTTPLHLNSSVANDEVRVNVRYTTDGSTPTTSSTLLDAATGEDRNANSHSRVISKTYAPSSNGLLSLILTISRLSGTGSVNIASGAGFDIEMWLEDCGLDPGDSGTDL